MSGYVLDAYALIALFNGEEGKAVLERVFVSGLPIRIAAVPGSRYFCESFYGHPCPTSGKHHATAHACGGPSRPRGRIHP
ncbi:MAG: hypothetical protein ACXWTK_07225 [Methylobacter sp.]